MPEIPWPAPLSQLLDRTSPAERTLADELEQLRAALAVADKRYQAATEARRAESDRAVRLESEIDTLSVRVAAEPDPARAGELALQIARNQALVRSIRGGVAGGRYRDGTLYELLVAENGGHSSRAEIERQVHAAEDRLESARQLNRLDPMERGNYDRIRSLAGSKDRDLRETPIEARDRGHRF